MANNSNNKLLFASEQTFTFTSEQNLFRSIDGCGGDGAALWRTRERLKSAKAAAVSQSVSRHVHTEAHRLKRRVVFGPSHCLCVLVAAAAWATVANERTSLCRSEARAATKSSLAANFFSFVDGGQQPPHAFCSQNFVCLFCSLETIATCQAQAVFAVCSPPHCTQQ